MINGNQNEKKKCLPITSHVYLYNVHNSCTNVVIEIDERHLQSVILRCKKGGESAHGMVSKNMKTAIPLP